MRRSRLLSFAALMLAIPATLFAQLSISITIAPPELVAYSQPSCPGSGYLWIPGYWAYGDEGYYWVPGTWVQPPAEDVLWTPGYWGWANGHYHWHEGYWGRTVGYYGGIDYGYGYSGVGYEGGYWNNGQFYYNRAVNNINVTVIQNTYVRNVSSPAAGSYVSYNGGTGGTNARPTAAQAAALHERHSPATAEQIEQRRAASTNRELLASVNHGKVPVAATSRPGEFTGKNVVPARGAATENRAAQTRAVSAHPGESKATAEKAAATRANESSATKRGTVVHPTENKVPPERATTRTNESTVTEKRAPASSPEREGDDGEVLRNPFK